jgi:hypothetical protein
MSLWRSRDRFQPRSQRLVIDRADDHADLVVGLAFAAQQAGDAAFTSVHGLIVESAYDISPSSSTADVHQAAT